MGGATTRAVCGQVESCAKACKDRELDVSQQGQLPAPAPDGVVAPDVQQQQAVVYKDGRWEAVNAGGASECGTTPRFNDGGSVMPRTPRMDSRQERTVSRRQWVLSFNDGDPETQIGYVPESPASSNVSAPSPVAVQESPASVPVQEAPAQRLAHWASESARRQNSISQSQSAFLETSPQTRGVIANPFEKSRIALNPGAGCRSRLDPKKIKEPPAPVEEAAAPPPVEEAPSPPPPPDPPAEGNNVIEQTARVEEAAPVGIAKLDVSNLQPAPQSPQELNMLFVTDTGVESLVSFTQPRLGMSLKNTNPVTVARVVEGGHAFTLGVRSGWQIKHVEGQDVTSIAMPTEAITNFMRSNSPRTTRSNSPRTTPRNGQDETLKIDFKAASLVHALVFSNAPLGMEFASDTPYTVSGVQPSSYAYACGVRPGWGILKVGGEDVKSMRWPDVCRRIAEKAANLPQATDIENS